MSDEHRSIGEVLELLREEFPDVTVSKIRFLESQGLIAPERTPSGYRKFYEPDVERLRWILTQQRDHYLPLKVIKSRLAEFEERRATDAVDGDEPASAAPAPPEPPPGDATRGPEPVPTGEAVIPEGSASDVGEGPPSSGSVESGAAVSREELTRLTGLDEATLGELEGFGLLPRPVVTGDEELYDEEAVVVGRLARGFLRHGVEVRHLRMYKTAAEREAVFVSQLVAPVLRQRNPEARQQARETVSELARLGGGMRAALLRMALRQALNE